MVGPSLSTHNPPVKPTSLSTTIKFLCSYGGKILPRYPDGKLRYHGGETRVLAVERSLAFAELIVKVGELCGTSAVSLRCQLPTEDLDALVSITSDEDLANLLEEYDKAPSKPPLSSSSSSSLKIRAFLSKPKSAKEVASPTSSTSSSSSTSPNSTLFYSAVPGGGGGVGSGIPRSSKPATNRCYHQTPLTKPVVFPLCYEKSARKLPKQYYGNTQSHMYLIHNGNHWQ